MSGAHSGRAHAKESQPLARLAQGWIVVTSPWIGSCGDVVFEPYCISEITSCDKLLLCLSAEVPACINSCLEVELEVSAA